MAATATFMTTGQVAELLGIPEYRLQDHIRHRKIIGPPGRGTGRRKRWTPELVEAARRAYARLSAE